jgi:menaquinone-specific isochorismate synthase
MTASSPPLVAVTRPIDRDIDPLAVAGSDGVLFRRGATGFAGRGVATRVARDRVTAALAAIEVDDPLDRPGTGPVAVGALPFLPDAFADLVVPSLLVGRDDDGAWVTTVAPPGAPVDPLAAVDTLLAEEADRPRPVGPGTFEVRAGRPPADWMATVADAVARIGRGGLEKVVLAREVVVTADGPIPVASVLRRLARSYPDCFLYLVDGFCGASPELLVSRTGDVVRAQPMAGTAPRSGEPEADHRAAAALLASPDYRHEHQITIDAVHDTLLRFSSYVDYEPEPSVVALANVVHLATSVEGRLSHPPASVLELVDALHPTPAVCGRPADVALRVIGEVEGFDRGRYAGAVGWVDARGNGEFAVGIRGATIVGNRAVVVGGNGIVAGSDPATELVETRAKLQAMLSAIVRP